MRPTLINAVIVLLLLVTSSCFQQDERYSKADVEATVQSLQPPIPQVQYLTSQPATSPAKQPDIESTVEARVAASVKIVVATVETFLSTTPVIKQEPLKVEISFTIPDEPTAHPKMGAESLPMSLTLSEQPTSLPAYDRNSWKHWIDKDGDCQDARQEVLIAESVTEVHYRSSDRCRVLSGEWIGPYTGTVVNEPSKLDVDHMVPLANAHRSGAWAWSQERKSAYANDLQYANHLLATTASANRAKGSRGPEEWRPSNEEYWCQYASDWIAIKERWGLTATFSEWNALSEMLDGCCESVNVTLAYQELQGPTPTPTLSTPYPSSPTETPRPTEVPKSENPIIKIFSNQLTVNKRVIVSFDVVPADKDMWIGLFSPGGGHAEFKSYNLLNSATTGNFEIKLPSIAGPYELRLYDDSNKLLAITNTIEVKAPAPMPTSTKKSLPTSTSTNSPIPTATYPIYYIIPTSIPAIVDAPTPIPTAYPNYGTSSGCCKICKTGKACGNSCISRSKTCHVGSGCACNG